MKLTREERMMIDDNSTKLVRRIVQNEDELAYLVYRIAAAPITEFDRQEWENILTELDNESRKLGQWVDAKLEALEKVA